MGDVMTKVLKYLKRIILASFLLYAYNLIAITFNMTIPINIFTILVVGFFDFVGLASLLIIRLIGM